MIKTVAHVDYVNGKNVKDITLEEQVALIQQTEAKIKEYSELTTKTKKIEKEIARLKENLTAAVILFDAE